MLLQSIQLDLFDELSAVNATGGSSMDWVHICLLNICWSGMTRVLSFCFFIIYVCEDIDYL